MMHTETVRHRDDVRRVSDAMAWTDRRDFLPPRERPLADEDRPLPIGGGQTNSQPSTVADMLRLLEVDPGMRVLDVGAGSGWTTAILAHLVGPKGQVVGVEIDPHLALWGAGNVQRYAVPWAHVHEAKPGVLGWPEEAPYDRILVSAEADTVPPDLVDQLGPDGVMVLPVAGTLLRLTRDGVAPPRTTRHGAYRFVPLR
jgi:protein-L-isoaspartate(D-aspartate) O-methyltransferase